MFTNYNFFKSLLYYNYILTNNIDTPNKGVQYKIFSIEICKQLYVYRNIMVYIYKYMFNV